MYTLVTHTYMYTYMYIYIRTQFFHVGQSERGINLNSRVRNLDMREFSDKKNC